MATTTRLLLAALALAPGLARGQPAPAPTTAAGWYQAGSDHYNLGEFDAAIEAFKRGFTLETDPSKKAAYLYNIAQAYRVKKDCANGVFFYKRFLEFKDQDTVKPLPADKRADVQRWITELEACAQQQGATAGQPPPGIGPTPTSAGPTGPTGPNFGTSKPPHGSTEPRIATATPDPTTGGEVDAGGDAKSALAPTIIALRLVGGATFLTAGDIDVPVRFTGALIGGYPIALGRKLTVEAGAAFTFAAVPADDTSTADSGTATFYGVMANAGLTYAVARKVGLRADVGIGALILAGAARSEYTGGADTTGALAMPHVRAGVSAEYAFTPNVIGTVAPFAFSYSPAKDGLREDIDAITAIDVMLGVGYRM